MFRWMLLGHLAGLWLSLEEVQCEDHTNMRPSVGLPGYVRPLWQCCDTGSESNEHDDENCEVIQDENLPSQCDKSQNLLYICKSSGSAIIHVYPTPANIGGASDNQCICKKKDKTGEQLWWCCLCINKHCAAVCHKEEEYPGAATTKFVGISTHKTPSATIAALSITQPAFASTSPSKSTASSISQPAFAPTSSSKSAGQLGSYQILLILLVLLVVALIVVAMVLIIRKRKFSGRSDVSMTRTNENEAVSSGYETTVRDNHYELSGEGVPIYTELQLTQEPAPSNSTVYSSVQPTGEAVDMGKRVVYAELDRVAVAVSPIYSQPFDPETSAINAEYAEPFKPDTTNAATAQVPNQYYNIAAVDQQNDVYSLAKAIPSGDPNVIYSQPNKPTK